MTGLSVLALAGLAACGRKNQPEYPPGSEFPREYPYVPDSKRPADRAQEPEPEAPRDRSHFLKLDPIQNQYR